MKKLRSPIDYKCLEVELREALRADELYKLQNDAKLRAIEQNVPTYEHFRQMVYAAHLKPLHRDDVQAEAPGSRWNPVAHSNDPGGGRMFHENIEKPAPYEKESANVSVDQVPITYEQMMKAWRTIDGSEAKFHYLRNIRDVLRTKICPIEIPSALFAEVINVCLESVSLVENIEEIVEMLRAVSECNRFRLTISFMEPRDRRTCVKLFRELMVEAGTGNEPLKRSIESLAFAYGIVDEANVIVTSLT